ncbi:MAG: hypothetical protein ACTH31_04115 [Pseudoclavibacter sp.]
MQVTGVENCGNSPKNAAIANWERALATGDLAVVRALLDQSIRLEIMTGSPERVVLGADDAFAALDALRAPLTAAHLDGAITHGKEGAAWGTWTVGDRTVHFAHAFGFATAKGDRLARVRLVHNLEHLP